MGDKILKFVEALLGGIITFVVLFFLLPHIISPSDLFSSETLILWFSMIIAAGFSLFIVFVSYHWLIKNTSTVSINDNFNENVSKTVWDEKKMQVLLGLVITAAYFYLLSLYDSFIAFSYSAGCIFFIPFILTRKLRWTTRICWVAALFAFGFLIAYFVQH